MLNLYEILAFFISLLWKKLNKFIFCTDKQYAYLKFVYFWHFKLLKGGVTPNGTFTLGLSIISLAVHKANNNQSKRKGKDE